MSDGTQHPTPPQRHGPVGSARGPGRGVPGGGSGAQLGGAIGGGTGGGEPEARVLVVDDEPGITDLLATGLRFLGFDVRTAASGLEALAAVDQFRPHLMLLDVMLPDLDGFEVLRRVRERHNDVAVVLVTARDDTADKVTGLTLGGDDYITKPFSLEEVVARIRAVLRRVGGGGPHLVEDRRLRYAGVEMDVDSHEAWRDGVPLELSPTEFALLRFLLENAEIVVSKAQILQHVWGYDFGGDGNVVESYIRYLRRKVDVTQPPLIQTVRGVGYVLRVPRAAA